MIDKNLDSKLNPQYKPLWKKLETLLVTTEANPIVIPHKIKWAKTFVSSLKEKPLINSDFNDIKAFLLQIESDTTILPYQVQHAKDSLSSLFPRCFNIPGLPYEIRNPPPKKPILFATNRKHDIFISPVMTAALRKLGADVDFTLFHTNRGNKSTRAIQNQ